MRVAVVNSFEGGGGAAQAARRLFDGLISRNVDASLITLQSEQAAGGLRRLASRTAPYLDRLPLIRYGDRRRDVLFTPGVFASRAAHSIHALSPDLVHLHWVAHGLLGIDAIGELDIPLVWTMHDMWPATGGCHMTLGCENFRKGCGECANLLSGSRIDLSSKLFERKLSRWRSSRIAAVAPSEWLAERLRDSPIFRDRRITVICNPVDDTIFRPQDRSVLRGKWNFPQDGCVLLFSAVNGAHIPFKGFHHLIAAAERLDKVTASRITVAYAGGLALPGRHNGYPFDIRPLGLLTDEIAMAELYAATLIPSEQENFPNAMIESLLCGTPVIAFDVGGIPEAVSHLRNGYLAPALDQEALSNGLQWICKLPGAQAVSLRSACRADAAARYSIAAAVQAYLQLYRETAAAPAI